MSLIDDAMEKCYIIDKATERDSYGGVKTTYKQGAEIMIAFAFNTSTVARIASQQGITDRYTIYTKKNVILKYPDIIQRDRDGKYFQVTSDGEDNRTPAGASLDLRAVEAEIWEIPKNE